jgi:hypothetical protein
MALDRYQKPYGSDTIVVPLALELPASIGARPTVTASAEEHPAERSGPPPGNASPPMNVAQAPQEADAAANAASQPPVDQRAIMAGVRGWPTLAVSGRSDGELTLWARASQTAGPQVLARLTLDRDGSQLFAGGAFVGRLFEDEGAALFLPDWLGQTGAGLQHGAGELLTVPKGTARDEEGA